MAFSVLQGVISDRISRKLYLSAQPPPFLTPASIAFLPAYMPICAGKNRLAHLTTSLSFAMGMNIVIGAIMNCLTLAYYALALCYVAGAWFTWQLVLFKDEENIRKGRNAGAVSILAIGALANETPLIWVSAINRLKLMSKICIYFSQDM
ncbi:hypothetical protein KIN20_034377 [Parelaphostrongylus tenuis]|uniref:Uncharacterized protein n=1 Tax=Parelaphostrongylus tenuis TaxID=148309 RepID=A0AAD5R9G2_PARTN|nr:hypothetical protein KIN20_034377 [Parelaphostrongylus tenuis]